jgi:predicted DNA-binding transcriptional regulator AlpA
VKRSLANFITRVSNGGANNEAEIAVLPEVARAFLEYFGNREEAEAGPGAVEPERTALPRNPGNFPADGMVSVAQVADFTGVKPPTVWARLKNGNFPEPVIRRKHCTRWDAAEVGVFMEKQTEA